MKISQGTKKLNILNASVENLPRGRLKERSFVVKPRRSGVKLKTPHSVGFD